MSDITLVVSAPGPTVELTADAPGAVTVTVNEGDQETLQFLTDRFLASLTTLRPNGTPHVVPVGFTFEPEAGLVRIITNVQSRKASNLASPSSQSSHRAVVCQIDGARWISLEGPATVSQDPDRVAEAVRRYAERYRQPQPNPNRAVIEIRVDRVLGSNARVSAPAQD